MTHLFFCRRGWLITVAIALFVVAQGPRASGQGAQSWDCLLTGNEKGVAQLTLEEGGLISGVAVFTFVPHSARTNHGIIYTNIFGSARVSGQWTHEGDADSGRVTGYLNFISPAIAPGEDATNGFSFRGVIRGEKMTLVARGYAGRVFFRGLPLVVLDDVSGTYRANGRGPKGRLPFVEIFTLTPATIEGAGDVLNCYYAEGGGPGYEYEGLFLLSRRNVAAFAQAFTTGEPIAAYRGRFDPSNRAGRLEGTDGVRRGMSLKIVPTL